MRNDPAFAVQRMTPPIDWRGVPFRFYKKVSAVCRNLTECEELTRWYGDATFMPYLPVLLLYPDHPTLLVGLGYASASELRDDAVNLWGKFSERMAKTGSIMRLSGDEVREKYGLARKEDVTNLTAEAFQQRILQHKASPVTDPFREPQHVRVNRKTVHTVAASQAWKDN